MRAFIGVTDGEWFDLLSRQDALDDVNFWQPSGRTVFRALSPGELFLFKLHSPDDYIVGGGVFAYSAILPVDLAWESFRIANGAETLGEMRRRIEKYRRGRSAVEGTYKIGCILLQQPFFLPRELWIPAPEDWSKNIVRGKTYDLTSEIGRDLLARVKHANAAAMGPAQTPPLVAEPAFGGTGAPQIYYPRLGQGTFRVLVTEAYERRCALTGERTLPALEAAHIRPFSLEQKHRIENGLLLRRDLHALFDRGYLSVTPDLHVRVSRRIREDYENGRDYYALDGREVRGPSSVIKRVDERSLEWHYENAFLG